jgi:hypothetical protein
MTTKTIRWILLGTGILLIVLAFLISDVLSGDRKFFIEWELYTATGSPDAVKLRVLEVNATATALIKVWSDSVNINWTTHQFTIQDDDKLHYFVMTAVDTAGNESAYSNIAVLDLAKPIQVFGVRIR